MEAEKNTSLTEERFYDEEACSVAANSHCSMATNNDFDEEPGPVVGLWQGGGCPAVQLSYLAGSPDLRGLVPLGVPMYVPLQLQAALQSGLGLNVIVAVLEGADDEDALLFPKEDLGLCRPQRERGGRNRRGGRGRVAEEGLERVDDGQGSEVSRLCSEAGSHKALRKISVEPGCWAGYLDRLRGHMALLVQSPWGAKVVVALLEAAPYGRASSLRGSASLFMQELVDSLPRAAMQASGRAVFLALILKCELEQGRPSATTRALRNRLERSVRPLAQCPHGSEVLLAALRAPALKDALIAALASGVSEVCVTPHGCRLLSTLLDSGSIVVASALLGSEECFHSLAWDEEWCVLLTRAAAFGPAPRARLVEQLRRIPPERAARCCRAVRVAACWR